MGDCFFSLCFDWFKRLSSQSIPCVFVCHKVLQYVYRHTAPAVRINRHRIFPSWLPWWGNPPPPPSATSYPLSCSITPRWRGSPPEAWRWGGPVLLHCGMQWGWQQCVGGPGPAGRVWAGCYTVCRLPRSWGRYDAGMAGEFFLGSLWNGCPLLNPTAHHSTLHLGQHLMGILPATLDVFR